MTSKLLLNIQHKVSLISPTAVVNLTRKTALCKYSLVEDNIFNGLNVGRCYSFQLAVEICFPWSGKKEKKTVVRDLELDVGLNSTFPN